MKFAVKTLGVASAVRKDLHAFDQKLARSTSGAMRKGAEGLKGELRAQITSAGMSQRLANTWRSAVYPKSGFSKNAAASVFSKAPHIIAAIDKVTPLVIRGKGRFLAIPTENAPKRGIGGKRITPSNFPEAVFGKLRFVYLKGGRAMLVVDNVRASYNRKSGQLRGFRKASQSALRSGRGLATVVMFLLVPQVKLRKVVDIQRALRYWGDDTARRLGEYLGHGV